ncbi:hypothetical protein BH10PSE7_BH10PSE7_32390 [soil metagenome]
MLTRRALFSGSAAAVLLSFLPAEAATWVKLGERRVDRFAERDIIKIGPYKGVYSKIKLLVLNNDVEFYDLKVVYGNGGIDDIPVRNRIRAGGETRTIDLRGGNRVLSQVVMTYGKGFRFRGPAIIVVLGLQSAAASSDWRKLGERRVEKFGDVDIINVSDRTTYTKLKIRVLNNAVNFFDVKVEYGNGQIDDIPVRSLIPAGGETRVIDLRGRNRYIRRIYLAYAKGFFSRGPAIVQVYGRES